MPGMPLLAHLTGGTGDGRTVEVPLEQLPPQVEFVTGRGTVAYERVGYTTAYRPAAVLDKLAAPAKRAAKPKTAADAKAAGAKAARPSFRS
jgi:hypothetical protein